VTVVDAHHVVFDVRPLVEIVGDLMCRCANEFDSAFSWPDNTAGLFSDRFLRGYADERHPHGRACSTGSGWLIFLDAMIGDSLGALVAS
jgi:hypothetical protein